MLIKEKRVQGPADLFRLKEQDLVPLERFAEKSAGNIVKAIASRRRVSLPRMLFALGIPNVGEHVAEVLAGHLGSLDKIASATLEELTEIHEIGPIVAREIVAFFAAAENRKLLADLAAAGVVVETVEVAAAVGQGPWAGKTFVFTGELTRWSREEAEVLVKARGGRASGSVSKRTAYVVAGPGAGSKLDKAQKLGVAVVDEAGFAALLEQAP